MTPTDQDHIARVAEALKDCHNILFITGAGLSADSNLPTYRGVGGLYNDAGTTEGLTIEEALSGGVMRSTPHITWKYLLQIEEATRSASHNRGHEVIAEMERHFPNVWTLTQNIDGFHRLAGSQKVIDIHGHLRTLRCDRCHHRQNVEGYADLSDIPPPCPRCGNTMRPDVVLFDEMLPHQKISQLRRILDEGFQMVFSIGTSSMFQYIVEPVLLAKRWRVPTVEINPGQTDLSRMVDHKIGIGAAEALDRIWKAFKGS